MSLLKWKEMAAKRSELGQRINEVRKTIKQKSISDQIGQVEAAKLFEPEYYPENYPENYPG